MSEELRGLEEELLGLRPVRPSGRVRAGVGRRLAAPGAGRRLGALAALAASLLLLWLAWPAAGPRPVGGPAAVVKAPAAPGVAPLPVLAAYREAMAGPPEELERLLARPGAGVGGAGESVGVSTSVWPD